MISLSLSLSLSLCVCACVRACVSACVLVCVCVCARACLHRACAGGEFEKVHLTVDDEGQIEQLLIKAMVWIHEAFVSG